MDIASGAKADRPVACVPDSPLVGACRILGRERHRIVARKSEESFHRRYLCGELDIENTSYLVYDLVA
jgi:hypothetical protein